MRQGSLLVIDDHEPNRDVLSRRLRQRGYLVTVASDGAEAVFLVRHTVRDERSLR